MYNYEILLLWASPTQGICVLLSFCQVMTAGYYNCIECGSKMNYQTTKHNGCRNCGFLPHHSAD